MRILNFGSINIDYIYAMDHFILPGETYSSSLLTQGCGGKGLNQSIALAQAGATVFHACKIGAEGDFLLDKLRAKGVDTRYIVPGVGKCGHAIIQVTPDGQNSIILYGGTNQQMDEAYIDRVLADFTAGDMLILQNEINLIPYIIRQAHHKGMQIAFNAAPFTAAVIDYPLEKLAWLVVNEVEGAQLTGAKDSGEIIRLLHQRYPSVNLLLTMGRRGCICCEADGEQIFSPAISVEATDTTAAGDTHFGFFIQGVLTGLPHSDALHLAAVASGIAVTRKGAADSIPTYNEVITSPLYSRRQ